MRKFLSLILTSAFLASGSVCPALADDWREHGDIHHFHEHDYDHWRGGSWFNGLHGGRHGWWWIVDGAWYFYPAPVYPYPDPYTPPVVVTTPAPVSPVGVPPSYVYYCQKSCGLLSLRAAMSSLASRRRRYNDDYHPAARYRGYATGPCSLCAACCGLCSDSIHATCWGRYARSG